MQIGADAPAAEEIAGLRNDVLRVLLGFARSSTGLEAAAAAGTIGERLKRLSDVDTTISLSEAALLVQQVRLWRQAFGVLRTCAQAGMLCRGMLYTGLIETLGSRLERGASWERFKDDLAEVPIEAMGMIPIVGEVVKTGKLIIDLCIDLFDKENALDKEAKDLIAKQSRAREFAEIYNLAMLTWVNWAVPLQRVIAEMLLQRQTEMSGGYRAGGAADAVP